MHPNLKNYKTGMKKYGQSKAQMQMQSNPNYKETIETKETWRNSSFHIEAKITGKDILR